jgi:hypothetical protein
MRQLQKLRILIVFSDLWLLVCLILSRILMSRWDPWKREGVTKLWLTDWLTDWLTHSLTHSLYGAEHHSKGHQLCSHSIVSTAFYRRESSLPHSQELFTSPYLEVHHVILSLQEPSQCYSPSYVLVFLMFSFFLALLPIIYTLPSSPIHATCLAHLILSYLIILVILGEKYKSCSSALCSFLRSLVTSSLFGPNILAHIKLRRRYKCYR